MKIDLKNLLPEPGVYLFKDKKGNVLYVGKAKNIKKRIAQYLKSSSLKVKKLLESAEDLEVIYTENEISALLKESNLIKKLNPPFNHLLKDDTKYFYLIFTKEKFPKVFITHQPEKFSSLEIIGPFLEGTSLKSILNTLRKEIPFCACREKHQRKCLNAEINLCPGYCCLKNYQASLNEIREYQENINILKRFFYEDLKSLKKDFLSKIEFYLKKNDLEKAHKYQKIYLAFKKIEENKELIKEKDSFLLEAEKKKILFSIKKVLNLEKLPHRIEVIDISHLGGEEKVGVLVTFIDGEYFPQFLRKFKIKTVFKPDDPRMIYEVLKRRLKHTDWGLPDLILVDGGKIQFKFAKKATQETNLKVPVLALAKPKKEIFYNEKNSLLLDNYPSLKNFFLSLDSKAHQIVVKYLRRRKKI